MFYIVTKSESCFALDKFSENTAQELERMLSRGFEIRSDIFLAESHREAVDNWFKQNQPTKKESLFDIEDLCGIAKGIVIVISFFCCWIFSMMSWGMLLGIGLGWLPSIFVALICGFLWPIFVLGLGLIIVFILLAIYG